MKVSKEARISSLSRCDEQTTVLKSEQKLISVELKLCMTEYILKARFEDVEQDNIDFTLCVMVKVVVLAPNPICYPFHYHLSKLTNITNYMNFSKAKGISFRST